MLQGLLQGELLEENIGGICSLVMLPCCFFFFLPFFLLSHAETALHSL